jgi:hypothetical protein
MGLLLSLLNARPRREAVIRTRGRVDDVIDSVRSIVEEPAPDGLKRMFSHGTITDGWVGDRAFSLDYRFNSARNPQTYTVWGSIEDSTDWRVVRLKIKASQPWLGGWTLAILVGYLGFQVYVGEMSVAASAWILAFVLVILALANVLYIPDVVSDRVSHHLAHELRGSVRERGGWVVPPDAT